MKYKRILSKMIKEEENKLFYLRVIINRPCTLQSKEYYKKEIEIAKAKIEALSFVLN